MKVTMKMRVISLVAALLLALMPLSGLWACSCAEDCESCARHQQMTEAASHKSNHSTETSGLHSCCCPSQSEEKGEAYTPTDSHDSRCLCQGETPYYTLRSRYVTVTPPQGNHLFLLPADLDLPFGNMAGLSLSSLEHTLQATVPVHLLHCVFLC